MDEHSKSPLQEAVWRFEQGDHQEARRSLRDLEGLEAGEELLRQELLKRLSFDYWGLWVAGGMLLLWLWLVKSLLL